MSNRLRFRSGQVELHKLRVDSDTILSAGDLVYLDTDDVKPASDFPFTTDLDTTRGNFAAVFLGVCHQASAAGETADVSIDLSPLSVYEFDVDASTFEVGSKLACDGDSDGLTNQQLAQVSSAALAIARAAEFKAAAASLLRVQFASAFHTASSNVNAAIG
ncbi:MAG: hypothetical protein B7Z55_00980 [Planctomycetales bacterium 12-60-4]|nr:MAG: hypothetical protein B7Z55_00980 [Planctomycetales bacterium 12-60-4]